MTIQAIPVPDMGSYSGRERSMQAQGFTLDGQGLLVRLAYQESDIVSRHAAWLYDLQNKRYTLSINDLLGSAFGQPNSDLGLIEIHAMQACV